jgi:hypothetical protein
MGFRSNCAWFVPARFWGKPGKSLKRIGVPDGI